MPCKTKHVYKALAKIETLKTFVFFLPNQKAERRLPFGTGLARHCPHGLFSPFFTFLRAIFLRPFILSLAPTICPWVSEDAIFYARGFSENRVSGCLKLMESTIKHPFKATTLPLKELCHDFYQYSNSRNRHQIDKPKNNRSKHLKKVLITQQIQKKARMDKNG